MQAKSLDVNFTHGCCSNLNHVENHVECQNFLERPAQIIERTGNFCFDVEGLKGMRIYGALRNISSFGQSTIYALSTPPGRSAIAIIRVSGPSTKSVPFPSLSFAPKAHG